MAMVDVEVGTSNVPLTVRQQDILKFMAKHFANLGTWPTMREIAEQFGISSTNGVVCHLKALLAKGHVARSLDQRSRSRNLLIPQLVEAVQLASENYIRALDGLPPLMPPEVVPEVVAEAVGE